MMNKKQVGWCYDTGKGYLFTDTKPTHISPDVWTPIYIDLDEQKRLREGRQAVVSNFMRTLNEWRDLDAESDEYFKIRNLINEGAKPYKETNNQRSITQYYLFDGVKYRTDDFDETIERYYGP